MRADPPRDGPPAGGSVLVTLADRSYLDQAKQLFASAYHDAGWRGDYLLLAHDLSGSETAWFADRGILVHHCRPLFTADVGGHPGVLASKLYLFTPDFRRWRTVIYCDADATIRASLDRLTSVRGFWSVDDVSGWLDVQV